MPSDTTHWGKLYGSLCLHPKWLATPAEGRALWTSALSYCIVIGSDGEIPEGVLHMLSAPGADVATSVQQLLDSGLWEEVRGGYIFHDWTDFQQTVDERKSVRAKRSEAGKASAEARRKSKSDDDANTSSTSVETDVQQTLNIEATEKRREEKKRVKNTDAYTSEFESWWKLYPSTANKVKASEAYEKAAKDHPDLEAKLRAYLTARERVKRSGEFVATIPNASTWLNQKRWTDFGEVVTITRDNGQQVPQLSKTECDEILGGSDHWSCPRPPEGLDLMAEREWKQARAAEHLDERRQRAWGVINSDSSAA